MIASAFFASISPISTFPQPQMPSSQYQAWQKPSTIYAHYLTAQPQVEVGTPNPVLDTISKVISLPSKIFGLVGQDTSRTLSEHTLNVVTDYLRRNDLDHTKVVSNLYKPSMIWQRTWTNPRTLLITKLFSGSCNALAQTIVPAKIFGGGINSYDQYTDIITLNNNDVGMALFAAAQAKMTAMRRNPILYNSVKDFCPLMTPLQNLSCAQDVLSYLQAYGTKKDLDSAYKTLGASSGVDFGLDIFLNPVFSFVSTVMSTYLLRGHFFTPVTHIPGESVSDLAWRAPMQSIQDQLKGYLYALPFLGICGLAGYYYGSMKLKEMNNTLHMQSLQNRSESGWAHQKQDEKETAPSQEPIAKFFGA